MYLINLSILTPNTATGNIYFGDPDLNSAGIIRYNRSTDLLEFAASGNVGMTLAGNRRLKLDQATDDGAILSFKSTGDVATG